MINCLKSAFKRKCPAFLKVSPKKYSVVSALFLTEAQDDAKTPGEPVRGQGRDIWAGHPGLGGLY